jgi:glycosyltransferase 2 family protein
LKAFDEMKLMKSFAVKILVTLLLLILVLSRVDLGTIKVKLEALSVLAIMAGIAICLLQNLALAGRWSRVTDFVRGSLSLSSAIQCTLISQLISQGLPASIGGDALRVWWLTRHGAPARIALLSVLLDRVAGFFALVVLCCFSVALLVLLITAIHNTALVFWIVAAALFACIFAATRQARRLAIVCYLRLPHTLRRVPTIGMLMRTHLRFQRCLGQLILSADGVKVLVWSLLIHLGTVTLCYIVVVNVSIPVTFWQLMATVPPVMLLSYLPISIGGWGVREGSMALALSVLGVPVTDGVFVGFVLGAFSLCAAAAGGAVWLLWPSAFVALSEIKSAPTHEVQES